MNRKYTVKDLAGNIVWEWDIEFDEDEITEAAERIGATAELVTTGAQLCDDNELGTRTIISGGEVFEIREGVSNQQWFENIKPLEY